MREEFTVIIERDEEGLFVGTVPSLRGCHTQARSLDELMESIKEAIQLYLEVEGDLAPEQLQLIGVQKVAL